jgi:hypothetical protein
MKYGGRLVLCACFTAAVLFSEFFIASQWDHDCCGEGCPVCCLVQGAVNFSRQLRPAPVFLILLSLFLPGVLVLRLCLAPVNSVRLKVKINR